MSTQPEYDSIKVASHMPLVYKPNFWDPKKAYMNYVPDTDAAFREGVEYAIKNKLETANQLMEKGISHALMLTDLQEAFRDFGELGVNGTDTVVLRVAARLINGIIMGYYTIIVYSKDGHPIIHISFDTYWRDHKGRPLDLSKRKAACLTLNGGSEKRCVFRAYGFEPDGSQVDLGFYQPQFDPYDAVDYWKHLQATGQGDIWVFVSHAVDGTHGSNVHPFLFETMAFASGARSILPRPVFKGHIIGTDWFGPLEPCRIDSDHPQGRFQKKVIDDCFKPALTVDEAGVAGDFCEYFMKEQVMKYLAGTEHINKLRFSDDWTANIVPDNPKVAEQKQRAMAAGIQYINHDDPLN